VPTKHLNLSNPRISSQIRLVKDQIQIELRARSLARLVEVSLDGVDAVFSDNYFDLPAGRSMTITTSLPTGWKISQVQAALKIQSIYDSFAH